MARARMWAIRLQHESKLYPPEQQHFITLTYNDNNIPYSTNTYTPTLQPRDFTLFMKRLRKAYGAGIRYFQCGEYGEEHGRPHHHAIIFGWLPNDLLPHGLSGDLPVFESRKLEFIWSRGFVTVASVNFASISYVTGYLLKKQITPHTNDDRHPEYQTMSRRPGIGRGFYDKYKTDLFNSDKAVLGPNKVYQPPKYYDSLYEQEDPARLEEIKTARRAACIEHSHRRLMDLEKSLTLKLKRKKRDYQK
jgi:hypothetical protein